MVCSSPQLPVPYLARRTASSKEALVQEGRIPLQHSVVTASSYRIPFWKGRRHVLLVVRRPAPTLQANPTNSFGLPGRHRGQ